MEDVFVKRIQVNKVRHLEKLHIPLSHTERRHLILTGKNGSGKTSLIVALKEYITSIFKSEEPLYKSLLTEFERSHTRKSTPIFFTFNKDQEVFKLFTKHQFVFAFFEAKRTSKFTEPQGPSKLDIKENYSTDEKANVGFMQLMTNQRFNYLNAIVNQDNEAAQIIDQWMDRFVLCLCEIFEDPELKLNFDSENFKYIISSQGKKFDLNTLSDGFSSAIHIVTELMMRMEKQRSRFYDMQGLVLIDEIETHLHIDLQKKILPFLTRFFPKIQFIVTTHSPFVLTSLKDAVVYDLEHQEAIEDLSGYSVEAIIEGYFSTDKYSQVLKDKVNEYEELMSKSELSEDEEDELKSLEKYFDDLSMVFADELKLKLEQIKLLNPVR